MPSFDIVSQVNPMEIENAVNQARKELASRFDFKASKAEIALEMNEIKLSAEDQFKIKALLEIVIGKLAKRGISLKNVDKGEPDLSPQGKLKVTTQIQGEEIRVTGKSKDELQAVIAAVRAKDFPVALSFQNFRE
ncbi:MAG: YajQ family cyclic di-GMP-binding protein [Verrucomicrobia bacterium]|nr:MAG: YajQ family cyclic di-GMP-binding protein [Verrucomicrobiota bacterium]